MPCERPSHKHLHDRCVADLPADDRAVEMERAIDLLIEAGADPDRLTLLPKDSHDNKRLAHFEMGEGALDNDDIRYYEYTPEEAVRAVRQGHPGFAVYYGMDRYGTEDVLAIDVDERSTFPYEPLPDTTKFVSGSGTGDHLLYHAADDIANSVGAGEVDGEVRAERLYTVLPGSTHPSGGIYAIDDDRSPADLHGDDLPESLEPSVDTVRGPEGDKLEIPRDPPEDLEGAEFTTEIGWSLESVRDRDEKLDRLLTRLSPGGYGGDRSRADAAAASKLWYWGFSRQDIAHILRRYRNYESMERDDYLYDYTIPFATGGERITDYYDDDGNYVGDVMGSLPLDRLDALSHDDRRRYAQNRGIEWPDVAEVRERLHDTIEAGIANNETAVKSAPTGSGKTYTVASTPWKGHSEVTDDQPVVHAHRTHEARDQAREMSDENGVDAYTLKGRKELCPVAAGAYDPGNNAGNRGITIEGMPVSEWMDHKCERQGLPFSHAHRWAESELDGPLPCQEGDTECGALNQFDGIPRNDDGTPAHDVIHATHQFLHVPSLRLHTNVVIDEKPAFGIDLTAEEVRESVNAYLDYIDAPVDSYHELVEAARQDRDPDAPTSGSVEGVVVSEHNASFRDRMDEALNGQDERVDCPECRGEGEIHDGRADNADLSTVGDDDLSAASNDCPNCNGTGVIVENRGQPPLDWYRETHEAHSLAPAFARAIWNAEESAGDRKHARVPYKPPRWGNEDHDEAGWNRVYVDVVLNDDWEVAQAESIPDFSLANSVIGLDAHPQPADPMWMANVHPDMTTDYTLSTKERTLYRRYERGLFTVQVGEGVQPVASGEWLDDGQGDKFDAIVKQLRDHYGEDFDSAITSVSARTFIRNAMEDAGVDDPEMMHYGAEESRNDFAGKNVGLVAGSIDPGDNMVVNLCARMGYDVKPCYKDCPACDGTGNAEGDDGEDEWCSTCAGSGEVRERGRTFEGEDAEQADAVLEGVREHHVAQSAGRWARDAADEDDHATVFIITEAAPTGFIDAHAPGVTWTANEDQRERLEYVRDSQTGATAKQVAEACDCSKQAAWRTLAKAEDEGLLERTPGRGPYGADVYSPSGAFAPEGAVDLGPDDAETVSDRVKNTYTYTVTVDALPNCAYNAPEGERRDWEHQSTFEMLEPGGPPPS
jgi:hypothetical protein